MLTSWTNTTTSKNLYTVTIGNIVGPDLTETEAKQVMDIINGMVNNRANKVTSKANAPQEKDEKQAKKDEFPKLNLIESIGFLSVYEDMYVRQWSETGFTPDRVKGGLRNAIKAAGATWDAEKKAYKFATKKAYNDFIKAQKAREAQNKKGAK